MSPDNPAITEMRAMIAESRAFFDDEVAAALTDIRERAAQIRNAVGEVSAYQALTALAGYARERIGQAEKAGGR